MRRFPLWRLSIAIALLLLGVCPSPAPTSQAQTTLPREEYVYSIAKSGDGRVLAVLYQDYRLTSTIDLFDSTSGALLGTVDLSPYGPMLVALSPTGDRLLWTDSTGYVGVYDIDTRTNEIISSGGAFSHAMIVWSPMDDIVSWTEGRSVHVYDVHTHQDVGWLVSDAERIVSFAWSPDGQRIATSHFAEGGFEPGERRTTVQLWDVSTISQLMTTPLLTIDDRGGNSAAWSPTGDRFAVVESGGFLVYDLTTDLITTITFSDEVRLPGIQWSPDGSQLATGGTTIHVWDTTTWERHDIPTERVVTTLQWSFTGEHIFHNGGLRGLYLDETPLVDVLRETAAD